MSTPLETPSLSRPRSSDSYKFSENLQPNIPISTTSQKVAKSPAIRSVPRASKHALRPPRVRKFVAAKKENSAREVSDFDDKKLQEAAYERPCASQEESFKKNMAPVPMNGEEKDGDAKEKAMNCIPEPESGSVRHLVKAFERLRVSQEEFFKKDITPVIKTEVPMNGEEKDGDAKEKAMNCIPEPESGRVRHLVKAFESLLSPSEDKENEKKDIKPLSMDWLMPPFSPKVAEEIRDFVNLSSFEERDSKLCSSLDGLHGRLSLGSRTSGRGRGSRRQSHDSMRKNWNKRITVTNQQPFKLRTEQRGRIKEQIFVKNMTEMLIEEEKKRIPIAQGLPWTTDEPECLIKPLVKECTEPLDIVLHSDVRAVERSKFAQHVTERLELAEQSKLERKGKQKMQEEEEIKKLRRELVPRAQPMPYFDRPFIPKKSTKPITVPKEPKFHA